MALVIKGSSSGQVTVDVPAAAGTNTLTIPASTGTVALTSDISTTQILHVRDEKGSTTSGGSASFNTTATRDLNTVVTNEITSASLGSNQITLPAGTYFLDASAPANEVGRHRANLYNVTDSAIALLGQSSIVEAANTTTQSRIRGRFTISGTKVFEIRHYTINARSVYGFGDYVTDGQTQIYTEVIIEKVS